MSSCSISRQFRPISTKKSIRPKLLLLYASFIISSTVSWTLLPLNLIAQTFLTISLEPPLRSAFLSVNIQFIDQHRSAGIAGCRNRINVVTHPLIALYFACKGNKPTYQNHAGDIGGKDGCVWMLYLGNYRHYLNQTNNTTYGDDLKKDYTIFLRSSKKYIKTKIQISYSDIPLSTNLSMSMLEWALDPVCSEH